MCKGPGDCDKLGMRLALAAPGRNYLPACHFPQSTSAGEPLVSSRPFFMLHLTLTLALALSFDLALSLTLVSTLAF